MVTYHWGVDSAQKVTTDLYNCVLNQYGKPEFWGRYLTRVEGASEELDREEIELLHNSGTKLLPIYNDFKRAVGENEGRMAAMFASYHAKRLGIRKGTPIFANIERFHDVDSKWILGYVQYMYNTDFKPGFYHDPTEGDFNKAYCEAVNQDELVAEQAVLWSAKPEHGVTKAQFAPKFKPSKVTCKGNVWIWQYGRNSKTCPIDTNLADSRLFEMLY